jgi:hypothetical protein
MEYQRIIKITMHTKYISFLVLLLEMIFAGCVKNTYDMNKLSTRDSYSPTFVISAASGKITLGDIVKANDTVVYDSDKSVRIIYKKDSVINFQLKDYYDLSNMVSFKKGYKIGEVTINDFQDSIPIKLSSLGITPGLVNGNLIFPSFGPINLGEKKFSTFSNFKSATFSSGTIEISVRNNLPTALNSINISLFDSVGHAPIGNQLTIPPVAPGATQTATLNLAGKKISNSIIAAIVFNGSPGTGLQQVLINLNSTIRIEIRTTNLKVKSGQIILPVQPINSLNGSDIISFDPGSNVEIESLKILTGSIGYTLISSNSDISGTFTLTLPKATKNGTPITEIVAIDGKINQTRSIILDNTTVDLSSDIAQPFNKIPVNYSMAVNFTNKYINFDMNDSMFFSVNMLNPNFDYVKGYFGQLSKQIDPDNLDTGLEDFMSNISGQFHISNPSITVNDSNSFGIPIEVTLNVAGKRNTQTVNLGLSPFIISSPASLAVRDVSSSFTINNANSAIASLVSLPPYQITFSGSAKMNPAGPTGGRNNYVFSDSRFVGSIEVNVPLQFWINNIQFSDTLDNFLKPDNNSGNNSGFKPEDMDSLIVNLVAENGFPMGVSVRMVLYDSVKKVMIKTINASNLILPAPIDATGKASGITKSETKINFNKAFFDAINSANKIILFFTLNTSENGTKDVKIYSDYTISFNASVLAKPRIKL